MTIAPYAGAPVSQTFRERWLDAPRQIGVAAPTGIVEIRRGRLNRTMHKYPGLGYPPFGEFPGALNGFWYPNWQAFTPWQALDGVLNIKLEQSFDNNGVTTCVIVMDNKALVPTSGHAGMLYHIVESGYYSPLRGFVGYGRPDPGIKKTPFFQQLPYAQIRVRQGYGADQLVTTFLGLIDDVDTVSIPNQLTLTGRDFGGVLVDEHFFGWAKEVTLNSPVTFAPRSITEKVTQVGGAPRASSTQPGHEPTQVLLPTGKAPWLSDFQDAPNDTQWIEIKLPGGKYSQIVLRVPFANQEIYISVKPTSQGPHKPATWDGQNIASGQWFSPHGNVVPGGGWGYIAKIPASTANKTQHLSMGGVLVTGNNATLRLGIRKLHHGQRGYQAGVTRLFGSHRAPTAAAIAGKYITVDDVSEIVKCCLRWTGFKTWEVEEAGVNLREPYVADPSKTFMDVIKVVKDMTGFTFFIGEPRSNFDWDIGYPVFRNNRVMENYTAPTEFIDDKLLLTDAKVKYSNLNDRGMIRCRGVARKDGVTLDGDTVKRLMYAYIPPWAGEQSSKVAGVIKSLTHTDEKFTTIDDVQFGTYLIALQIALGLYTAIIDLPANPGIGVDTLQSVIDRTQGLNSRIYVTNRHMEMSFGQNGYWTMELGGSLVDTPQVDGVVADYLKALIDIDLGVKNPYLRKRSYGYQNK